MSYELAGRLLAADEEAKAKLNKDLADLQYDVVPKPPAPKPSKSCKITNMCTYLQVDDELSIIYVSEATVTGEARQNMPALSKLVKITEEENKVVLC